MSSISKKPDYWDKVYLNLCLTREYGRLDDEVAEKYGFTSPQELYLRLNSEGFQVCKHCGVRSAAAFHCKDPESKMRKSPRKEEEVKELPPTYQAAALFKDILKNLIREVEELRDRW